MEDKVFKLTVVRHGQTDANRQGIIQGHTDWPLSKEGYQQAALLGERLKDENFTHIFSSDLKRARQTMDAVIAANHCNLEIVEDHRLRERNYGIYEGKKFSDLIKICTIKHIKVEDMKTGPNSEDVHDLYSRAMEFFKYLCETLVEYATHTSNEKLTPITDTGNIQVTKVHANALIVSHGGFIRQLLRYLNVDLGLELPHNDLRRCSPNTGVSTFLIHACIERKGVFVQQLELHSQRHLLSHGVV